MKETLLETPTKTKSTYKITFRDKTVRPVLLKKERKYMYMHKNTCYGA